jgi:transcription elongation factor Elf1
MSTTQAQEREILACPFCGHVGLSFDDGSTHRWGVASCEACGASAGETRREYPDKGEWHSDAIEQWNRRAGETTDDASWVIRNLFDVCEDTENKLAEPKNDFERGRAFEAKHIRRGMGNWFQDEFCGRSFMGEPALPERTAPAAENEDAALLDIKPQLGAETAEPSLTHLVRKYYGFYFEKERADKYASEYLDAIRAAMKEARGSFMTREQAIEFCRRRRPGIDPTEQHIAATIDAYSALYGDMVPADFAPTQAEQAAQVQEPLSEERVEAAAMEMASTHWHWDRLGEVERNGFRARARDVLTAAWGVQLTKEGGNG